MITNHDVSTSPPPREDSLHALAARDGARRAAPTHAADDSGVIDLDALRVAGPISDDLVTARLVATPAAAAAQGSRPSAPRWAVATLGLLGGAVVALGTMVGLGMPHGTKATQDPADTPMMAAASLTAEDTAHEHRLQLDAAVIPHVEAPMPAPEVAPTPAPEPVATAAPKRASKSRSKAKAKPKAKPKATPTPAAKAPSATPKPAPSGKKDELSVNCILDPASCGRGGKAKTSKPAPSAPSGNLPDKLSASQIRSALSGPKAKAKQCADMHAAPAGTKVSVKLSVAGSGKVRSATPLAPHANGLGRCVANALKSATFDRFAAPAMGVVYSVRL